MSSEVHPLRDWRNREGEFAGRRGEKVSQRDLAARVGVVASQIGQIESDYRRPSLALAAELAKISGIAIERFVRPLRLHEKKLRAAKERLRTAEAKFRVAEDKLREAQDRLRVVQPAA